MEHRYQVRIDKELFKKFEALCKEKDRSINAQINNMIKRFVEVNEKGHSEKE